MNTRHIDLNVCYDFDELALSVWRMRWSALVLRNDKNNYFASVVWRAIQMCQWQKKQAELADEDTYLRATSERKLSLISLIHEATSLVSTRGQSMVKLTAEARPIRL